MKPEQWLGAVIPLVYFVMLGIEARHAARSFVPVRRWLRTGLLFFVLTLVIGSMLPQLLAQLLPLAALTARPLLDLSGLGLLGIVPGLLTVSFFGYWIHRAEHRFDWLWRITHQLHHSPQRVDMAGAYFSHPFEVMLKVTLANLVGVWLLGLTPLASAAVGVIGALLSMWQHWNITTPHWLGYLIPRPESHVLHHASGITVRNFGDLPIWDMLFGTFDNPRQSWHGQTGFDADLAPRIGDMLLLRDVHKLSPNSNPNAAISRLQIP
jgi:sterol desaturase/sphingolipid hydroxylase (fatty acid hydroxylase superfamily)